MTKREEELEVLGEAFAPPTRSPRRTSGRAWQPKLGTIGTKVLLDNSPFILLHGERMSGKTSIALHKAVLHCYNNHAASAMLVSIIRTSATEGGLWEKINSLILPEWADGIGLEFTEPKMDDQKKRYVFISNKFGGWSKAVLMSMPYGSNIASRMKGSEPSFFFFDELTDTFDSDYFIKPIQQLRRRPHIEHQQYIGACNPSDHGEDHWVYQKFMVEPMDEVTKKWDKEFAVYHIPITENVWSSQKQIDDYRRSLMIEARNDPSATARSIEGKWVKRPTGIGLFAESFNALRHVKGDRVNGIGLQPLPGFPIFISYDLGPRYSSATFEQFIPTADGKLVLIIFDEVDVLDRRVRYRSMAKDVISRIKFWEEAGKNQYQVLHVSDESATSQWRAGGEDGSYDAWEFEVEFNREWPERKMKMQGAPKGKGSVSARVNCITNKLLNDEMYVSALCPNTIEMLRTISEDKEKPGHPAKGRLIHKFDSLSYAPFKMETQGARKLLQTKRTAPSLIRCGSVTPQVGG